ncbi:hypothetical protein ACWDBD_45590 [Streptomyces sp. NPDC001118]
MDDGDDLGVDEDGVRRLIDLRLLVAQFGDEGAVGGLLLGGPGELVQRGEQVAVEHPDLAAENEADVRDLFDLIVCLVMDEDTLRHRLATRTTNAFGHHPEELAAALKWNPRMRAIYQGRGATNIDASKPVTEVVYSVIDAVQGLTGSTRHLGSRLRAAWSLSGSYRGRGYAPRANVATAPCYPLGI